MRTLRDLYHKDLKTFNKLLKGKTMSIEKLLGDLVEQLKALNVNLAGGALPQTVNASSAAQSEQAPAPKKGKKPVEKIEEETVAEPARTPAEIIDAVLQAPAGVNFKDPVEAQARKLLDLIAEAQKENREALVKLRDAHFKVKKFSDLTFEQWDEAITKLGVILAEAQEEDEDQNFV